MDVNDKIGTDRFDDEDDAKAAWWIASRPMFLDQVIRYESRI
jgi:hypothetical protein